MNLASKDYQEKRNFIRMKVETPIAVKSDSDTFLAGICHNLSGGGMLVALPRTLNLGDRLEVTVSSNHSHSPMLKALTRVCRVDNRPNHKDDHYHGLEIEEMIS